MIKCTKINESYSQLTGDLNKLKDIYEFLKVERPGAYFDWKVKNGFESPYQYFSKVYEKTLIILNGHLDLLKSFNIEKNNNNKAKYTLNDVDSFYNKIKDVLPFEPRDYQLKAFKEAIVNQKMMLKMCTSSGKSYTISLICEFFRQQGLKGILLVPNINLLTQFKEDIGSYNLTELYNDTHTIGGGQTEKHLDKSLTITTWQSMMNYDGSLDGIDYVICDECHRFASEETSGIVLKTVNCQFKYGFTGTIPEDPCAKMQLFGLFGAPKTYITSRELIERGLGTPISINAVYFDYDHEYKQLLRASKDFRSQLTYIKENEKRNDFIVDLMAKLRSKGNTLTLFQHTQHGKDLFIQTMKRLFPDVEVQNKNITGKKSFEFQEKYRIYFLNGEDDAKTRELTRKILEKDDDAILIANYSLLSTGVNIKKLHNMILASPLKAYTTVTQSIGRGMRLHDTKMVFNVFDLIDNTGVRGYSGTFVKQYKHRLSTSYNPEEFPVKDYYIDLK